MNLETDPEQDRPEQAMIQELKLAPNLMPAVRAGSKNITIRRGARDLTPGRLRLISAVDDADYVDVEVYSVEVLPFADISLCDIRADGGRDHGEMLTSMLQFYPGMTFDERCTVVKWHPSGS